MTRFVTLSLLAVILLPGHPCAAQSVAALPPASAASVPDAPPDVTAGPYVLAPADVLEISVQGHEDLHQTVTVLDDGTFQYPVAGKVQASGKTVDAVQAELTRGVSTLVKAPQVTVLVRDAHPRRISVAGAVHAPGLYPYHPGMRLLELLAACGGPAYTPEQTGATLLTAQGTESVPVDLVALMGGAAAQNALLSPGDVLLLTPRDPAQSMIQVVGDVERPGQYPVMSGGATVLSLLTDAGGANPTAALSKAQVMHAGRVRTVDLHPLTFNLDRSGGQGDAGSGRYAFSAGKQAKGGGARRSPCPVRVTPFPMARLCPSRKHWRGRAASPITATRSRSAFCASALDGRRVLLTVNADSLLKGNAQVADATLKTGDILVVPTRHRKQGMGEYINQIPGIYTLSHLFTGF